MVKLKSQHPIFYNQSEAKPKTIQPFRIADRPTNYRLLVQLVWAESCASTLYSSIVYSVLCTGTTFHPYRLDRLYVGLYLCWARPNASE